MKRAEATRQLEQLLERLNSGRNIYLDAVEEVSVFGSYAAGALAPNDVDVAVEYQDRTGAIGDEQISRMFSGRSVETPFAQALREKQRGLKIVFNARKALERQGGFAFTLLWRRGDRLTDALDRLYAITVDPAAASAPRDYVHPVIAGFEQRVPISARHDLVDAVERGEVCLKRLEIERDIEPGDGELRRLAGEGYSASSPRRRATRALLAHLEREGIPVEGSHREVLLSRELRDRPFATVQHGADRLGHALHDAVSRFGRSYCVMNLAGKQPLIVVQIEAAEGSVTQDADSAP